MTMPTLFNEMHIKIEGNPLLEGIANHILDLTQHDPEILNGKKIGEINRKITLAIYFDSGLYQVLQSGSKEAFTEWFMKCNTEEEIARALRYLTQRDIIRLSKAVIEDAIMQKQHISNSVKIH